jgi:NitT/TauT family transport system permease protein
VHFVRVGLVVIGLLACWQLIVMLFDVPLYLLPTPLHVLAAFREYYALLLSDSLITGAHAALGLILAMILAFVLAVGFVHSQLLQAIMLPIISSVEAIPKVAFAPLLVLWLGIGSAPKVAIAASIAFFPLVINLTRGFRDIDPDILSMIRVWQAPWWRVLLYVRLPNSLGSFFDGLRIAAPNSLIGAILAEFIASDRGLGHRVLTANASLHVDVALAAIICIAAIAVMSSQLIAIAERRLLVWQIWKSEL